MAVQITSGSQREKWVATAMPATAILLVGFLYISFYAMPAFEKTEKEYNRAIEGGVQPDVVADLDAEAQQLRDDQTELERIISSFDDELTQKSDSFQRLSPTLKHSAVTALCREHGVAVMRDEPVDSIRLSGIRNKSVETLQTLISKEATSFRELTVACDYATIVTLLKKLPEVSGVIPVSVTLKKASISDSLSDSPSSAISWTVGLLM